MSAARYAAARCAIATGSRDWFPHPEKNVTGTTPGITSESIRHLIRNHSEPDRNRPEPLGTVGSRPRLPLRFPFSHPRTGEPGTVGVFHNERSPMRHRVRQQPKPPRMKMQSIAPTLRLPESLQKIADQAAQSERDREDAAATAALAALKASDPEPKEIGEARAALARGRASVEKARAALKALETTEYEAGQLYAALSTERDRHRRALARLAHAPHRVAAARERIEKELEKIEQTRQRSTEGAVGFAAAGAAFVSLSRALQELSAATAGDAHRVEHLDSFAADAIRRAQEASETAATEVRLKRSRAEAARKAMRLWGSAA